MMARRGARTIGSLAIAGLLSACAQSQAPAEADQGIPQLIGDFAQAPAPARLVLTHNMNRSLDDLERGLAAIGTSWRGEVTVAADLDCFAL